MKRRSRRRRTAPSRILALASGMAGFLLLASGMAGLFLLAPAADALTIPVTPLASAQLIAIAPEPGTFLLAGTGLLGLAWQGRRRSDPRVRPRARTSG